MEFPIIATAFSRQKTTMGYPFVDEQLIETENEYKTFVKKYADVYNIKTRPLKESELINLAQKRLKPIHSPKKIVRVEDITEYNQGYVRKVYLMSFESFVKENKYKTYGHTKKLYPYKWYSLNRLIDIPAFYLKKLFTSETNLILETSSKSIHIIKIIIYLISAFASILGVIDYYNIKF